MIKLNEKLGYNMRLHPNYNGDIANRYIYQKLKAVGAKYIRLYSNVEQASFDSNTCKMNYLYDNVQEVANQGFTPVLPLIIDYPAKKQDINASDNSTHCYWSDTLQSQFKRFFKEVVQHIESMRIKVIYEAFNEAPGGFWSSYGYSYNNQDTINSYMDMNDYMRQTVYSYSSSKFIDLCSCQWAGHRQGTSIYNPKALDTVLTILSNRYAKLSDAGSNRKADYISFHPYMETAYDNGNPEILLFQGSYSDYANINTIPQAWTEFGFANKQDWNGNFPPSTQRALVQRQILIGDYMGVDIMIPYSARVYNYDWGGEECTYNFGNTIRNSETNTYSMNETGQGVFELLTELKGYHFNQSIDTGIDIFDQSKYLSALYAFEYVNDSGNKKLVYWTPSVTPITKSISWNGIDRDLTFKYNVQFLES